MDKIKSGQKKNLLFWKNCKTNGKGYYVISVLRFLVKLNSNSMFQTSKFPE